MIVRLSKRVRTTWKSEERDLPPEEIKVLRASLRSILKNRLAAAGPNATAFTVTPIGEYTYAGTSGTCTQLAKAGVCVACLGTCRESETKDPCKHCLGTGDM